jgi:hypothetical protein
MVVTPMSHVARTRMLFDRCTTQSVTVVAPEQEASLKRWLFEAGYQSAAFLKAAVFATTENPLRSR